ncbi:MAG: precorrin-6A reductase [Verrucomicrobia bacterium]|nr:MAG: precorrin-6A reductase [Verrucomicrobiota bacterium]
MVLDPAYAVLGGIAESREIAACLLDRQWRVILSTATDFPFPLPASPALTHRRGPLDAAALSALITASRPAYVILATHPYAENIRKLVLETVPPLNVPLLIYLRPAETIPPAAITVDSHAAAAATLSKLPGNILLTTGARNAKAYSQLLTSHPNRIYIRVLPGQKSHDDCLAAGFPSSSIIQAKGPFSTTENIRIIRQLDIQTLVTKESGKEGGFPEKIEATRETGIRLIVIRRPPLSIPPTIPVFNAIDSLIQYLQPTQHQETQP